MAFRYASIGTIQNCMEHEVFCCGHAWGCRPGDQRTSKDISVHGPQSPHGLWTGRGHWWSPLRVGNHGRVIIYGVSDNVWGSCQTENKCFVWTIASYELEYQWVFQIGLLTFLLLVDLSDNFKFKLLDEGYHCLILYKGIHSHTGSPNNCRLNCELSRNFYDCCRKKLTIVLVLR